MRVLKVFFVVFLMVFILSGCIFVRKPVQHGRVVSVSEPTIMTREILQAIVDLSGANITLLYDVHAYKLTFETVGPDKRKSIQTGLMLLPDAENTSARGPLEVSILSIQHGTIFSRQQSPSFFDPNDIAADNPEDLTGIIAAGLGYATFMPDYGGLGSDMSTFHPFCDEYSIAYSVLDMIKAGKAFLEQKPAYYTWNDKLFLAGYSEGGYATMAASKLIQNHSDFTITGTAPMAGPYNMSHVMKSIVTRDDVYDHLEFLSYMLFGYYKVYGIFDSPSDVLIPPYDTELVPLFDGEHTSGDVKAVLPGNGVGRPDEIFTDYVFERLNAMSSQMNYKLKSNDLYNTWVPEVPILMIHSAGDEAVPVENSRTAKDYYESQGAVVNYIELPNGKHVESYIPAFLLAFAWIEGLNQ
jgi:fermentation-respiration switch protein FrsA (DUF1100 family)